METYKIRDNVDSRKVGNGHNPALEPTEVKRHNRCEGKRRDDVVSTSHAREQRTRPTSRLELYDNVEMALRRIWKGIQNGVHEFIKLISKICKFAKLSTAFSDSARGFNSYRIPELPRCMSSQQSISLESRAYRPSTGQGLWQEFWSARQR